MDYAVYDLDFTSEGRRRVNLFSYILGYSRRQYLRFVEAQDMTTTLREHVRAFEHLGGVAATCLYDNMKVVVTGYEDDVPIYNPRFLAFATHYGFRPVACRPAAAPNQREGGTPVLLCGNQLVQRPQLSPRSIISMRSPPGGWPMSPTSASCGKPRRRPCSCMQDELPHLIPLPAQPYDVSPVVYRTVNVEGLVTYCQNGYSVPWRYIGSMLPVRITEKELIVYGPQVEEIARHVLLPAHGHGATESCTRSTGPSRTHAGGRRSWRNGLPNWVNRAVGSWRVCSRFSVTARTRRSGCWPCWGPTPGRT